ncbi:hypothetical protein VIGAN_01222600, partial [Vigna angularis var. angularis]
QCIKSVGSASATAPTFSPHSMLPWSTVSTWCRLASEEWWCRTTSTRLRLAPSGLPRLAFLCPPQLAMAVPVASQ